MLLILEMYKIKNRRVKVEWGILDLEKIFYSGDCCIDFEKGFCVENRSYVEMYKRVLGIIELIVYLKG